MSDRCMTCGGKCCRYFCFEIEEPDDFEEFEDVRWYLCHEGVSVHIDEDGDWYISIANRCTMLGKNNQCQAYENRPLICRKYDPEACDQTDEDYGYQEEFDSPDELDEYARDTLGTKTYEREKRKHREKLDRKTKKKLKKMEKAHKKG